MRSSPSHPLRLLDRNLFYAVSTIPAMAIRSSCRALRKELPVDRKLAVSGKEVNARRPNSRGSSWTNVLFLNQVKLNLPDRKTDDNYRYAAVGTCLPSLASRYLPPERVISCKNYTKEIELTKFDLLGGVSWRSRLSPRSARIAFANPTYYPKPQDTGIWAN